MSADGLRMPDVATCVAVTAAAGTLVVVALRTAQASPELGYTDASASGAAEIVTPCLVALGLALGALRRQTRDRTVLLLGLAALASLLPELSVAGTRPAAAFTAGLVFAWATPPVIAHLALVYPGQDASGIARTTRNVGYVAAIAGLGFLPALVFDPVAAGCGQCARNLVLVRASPDLETAIARIAIVLALAWAAASVMLILNRLARATPTARQVLWPVLIPAAALTGCFAIELALSIHRAYLSTGDLDRKLWLGGQVGLVAVALGFASRSFRTRQARSRLARDVVELSAQSEPETVAARLAAALGDPTLEIAHNIGDPPRLVDAAGVHVDLAPQPGRATTRLVDARTILRHRDGLLDDPALVEEITRSAGLALANERLRADAQARLASLRASRKRIVEVADQERRLLEHNLHDGAQQRLVSLAVALRAARSEGGDDAKLLDEARRELAQALDELRVIARGIYPAVLTELGLAAAIEALAETAPVPLKVAGLSPERLDPIVEAAGYFVVAEIARDPASGPIAVGGSLADGALKLSITTIAEPAHLTRLSDRVGAAGGTIRPRRLADRHVLDLEIPCAS